MGEDAARVGACVALQDKTVFWKLHDVFFGPQQSLSKELLINKALAFSGSGADCRSPEDHIMFSREGFSRVIAA
jgi:hypothetical protein